jgi:hypothetical protein
MVRDIFLVAPRDRISAVLAHRREARVPRDRKHSHHFCSSGTALAILLSLCCACVARSGWEEEICHGQACSPSASQCGENDHWLYRKAVPVSNNTTQESNVFVSITSDTSDTTKFQNDCGDLRFTNADSRELPYYVESGCSTGSTNVFVLLDVFPAGGQTLCMYYGNPSATDGFQTALESGSVNQTDMKLSIASGTAFTDFSSANILTPFANRRLKITDSASKKLVGFIKNAGTGETYGSENLSNGDFETGDPPVGWIPNSDTTLSRAPDPRPGSAGSYSMDLRSIAGNDLDLARADNASFTNGALCYFGSWLRNVDMPAGAGTIETFGWKKICVIDSTDTSWKSCSNYATADTNLGSASIPYWWDTTANRSFRADDFSMRQVLTPSVTGVTITSMSGGSTYNWLSEEGSFNRNDESGYAYVVYPVPFTTEASDYTVGSIGAEERGSSARSQ